MQNEMTENKEVSASFSFSTVLQVLLEMEKLS